jgi:hypothetical protein
MVYYTMPIFKISKFHKTSASLQSKCIYSKVYIFQLFHEPQSGILDIWEEALGETGQGKWFKIWAVAKERTTDHALATWIRWKVLLTISYEVQRANDRYLSQ